MTFHFPYMHILNLKEKEKDQALSEFGLLTQKKEAIMKEYRSFEVKKDEFIQQAQERRSTSIADIQQRNEYLSSLDRRLAGLKEQIELFDKEIADKQTELLAKQQEEKTWFHLRDKSYEKYIQKQKKIEQDLMDEMATIRYYHQRLSI
ncbi:flagellar export protein FliJ [Neobacillus sp. Marseille-QA0830]